MEKILILYFSGVGNTKQVAQKIASNIPEKYQTEIYSIEATKNKLNLEEYKAIIIGFPTFHTAPAEPMVRFIEKLQIQKKPIPAYIFTTYGLYSSNTLRIFAKKSIKKNIIPVLNKGYRCKATDGILLTPFIKFWFTEEKNLNEKIAKHTEEFINMIDKPIEVKIPRVKIYSILNYPNKLLGKKYKFKIYINKKECVQCINCVINCPVNAYLVDEFDFPEINTEKCINCYRCIHHCRSRALSLSRKKIPKRTLYR